MSNLNHIRKFIRQVLEESLELEDINVPINVGDEVLGGKFKNKKITVKDISKNEKGDITINKKPLLRFRIKEIENLNSNNIKCFKCGWEWKTEKDDKNPFLCHKCGYDNKEKKFDYKSLEHWKETNKQKSIEEQGGKGLWDNIHAKRKRGESTAKPGDKEYPKKSAWKKNIESSKNENYEYIEDELTNEELEEAYNCLKKSNKFKSKDGNFELYEVDESYYSNLNEAEYHGRKVSLGKIMKGDVKKSKVFVKNPNGKIVKVNFGDPNMKIKKHIPARRKSFRARMRCDNPGPKWKARYWACRTW